MIDNTVASLMRSAFDDIEEAYEFMLAYAAQGRKSEGASGSGPSQIRQFLQQFNRAMEQIASSLEEMDGDDGFRRRWLDDLSTVGSIIDLLLAQPAITSEMIDNTNGLIAVRSLLTDIFFADHVMLPKR